MGLKRLLHVDPKLIKLTECTRLNVNRTLSLVVVALTGSVGLDRIIVIAKGVDNFKYNFYVLIVIIYFLMFTSNLQVVVVI